MNSFFGLVSFSNTFNLEFCPSTKRCVGLVREHPLGVISLLFGEITRNV